MGIREHELSESTQGLIAEPATPAERATGLILPREYGDKHEEVEELISFEPLEDIVGDVPAYGRAFWELDAYQGDQDGYDSCTGGSARNLINCAPIKHAFPETLMYRLYDIATHNDPFYGYFDSRTMTQYGPGGSSMPAIARAVISEGFAVTFAATSNVDTMFKWGINYGPGLLGMAWGGCFRVDDKGYVHPDGSNGGHATMVHNFIRGAEGQVGPDRVRGANQWGQWGLEGDYRMTLDELSQVDFTFICIAEVGS